MTDLPMSLVVLDLADDPNSLATHYRLSTNEGRTVYVSIDAGVYEIDDCSFTSKLPRLLPPFPSGDWNKGHITKSMERPEPHFAWTRYADLPSITALWHQTYVDFHELGICEKLMPNVAEASHPVFGQVIAKYARFEWEIASYHAETEAYHWLNGHHIGPQFLGHLTEGARVIGFLLQKLDGHDACARDLARCEEVVRKLHSLDILHGDLNRHNFLVHEERVTPIDFETAVKSTNEGKKAQELQGLGKELLENP
ncbi:MAG: hypothetical protein L6R40_006406 [Gallowayella cf. fulva]|nr:MAG: hypothetical protein L6R40_006406 [Xanthomendoza cf. fulva]